MAHQNHQELLAQQQLQLVDIGRLIVGLSEEELKENSALYVFLKAFLSNFEMPSAA